MTLRPFALLALVFLASQAFAAQVLHRPSEAEPGSIDPQKMTVTLDGAPVDVTAYEFSILRALAQRPGRVLSREQLLDLAKGSAELSFDRSIDVHVSRLRAKLGDDSRNPKILKTVRGAGYLLAGGDI